MGIRTVLDHDLVAIRDDILRMGSLVNQAVGRAIDAFTTHDIQLAQEIIKDDDTIDGLHQKLEEHVTATVALQQPMASDLRRLVAALLIANELERMGDYAEGIARTTLLHGAKIPQEIIALLKDLQWLVGYMIATIMEAYLNANTKLAREVARRDAEVDVRYKTMIGLIVTKMGSDELPIEHGTHLMWVGHNLERIGDRVTNISERIVYASTGDIDDFNPRPAA